MLKQHQEEVTPKTSVSFIGPLFLIHLCMLNSFQDYHNTQYIVYGL